MSFWMAASFVTFFIIVPGPSVAENMKCKDCPNYGGILTCDPQTCDWLLLNGYWAGNLTDGGELLICYCPIGYCTYNDSDRFIWIPRDSIQTIEAFLCNGSHRTGAICGQCQPGYAPAINSDTYSCVPCDAKDSQINWIYYLLAVYAPLLVVFLVIILFNIRLTNGPLNSFILFAQVISTTVDINQAPLNLVYGKSTNAFQKSYEIPYNLFNLNLLGNFLPPFCLHSGLDTLSAIALRYAEAFFPMLIIVAIVLLVRCRSCIKTSAKCPSVFQQYRIGSSMVHAFAAFVLLSYNRLCEITSYLLTTTSLSGHTLYSVEERLFFQGNYTFDDPSYSLRYKLPAYLMLIVLALVSMALLHYPVKWLERLVSQVSCLRKVYPTASIVIMLDTFQGCFRDNRRYFAGLYLALRLLLFLGYILPFFQTLLIQQILFVMYILLLFFLKPYKEKYINYLDIFIFANLALINISTWYTNNQVVHSDEILSIQICIVIESILVFIPMAYFVAYLLWYITRRYHKGIKRKLTERYHVVEELFQRRTNARDISLVSYNTTPYVAADGILSDTVK